MSYTGNWEQDKQAGLIAGYEKQEDWVWLPDYRVWMRKGGYPTYQTPTQPIQGVVSPEAGAPMVKGLEDAVQPSSNLDPALAPDGSLTVVALLGGLLVAGILLS